MAEQKPDSENSKQTPNPGSDEAMEQGCTCPVMDNCHGEGFPYGGKQSFYVNENCPVHGKD